MPESATRLPPDKREIRVVIDSDRAILAARQLGRSLASNAGFSPTDLALISTAISELARNTLRYARTGELVVSRIENGHYEGVMITAVDQGPGIPSISQAMMDGFSTSGGLGLGLPGVRRLMDDFEITSEVGRGTTVTVKKWKR